MSASRVFPMQPSAALTSLIRRSVAQRPAWNVPGALSPTSAQSRGYVNVPMSRRRRKRLPVNFGINFVPQQQAWVVERFGKFHSILQPGLSLLIPIVDEIKYVHTLKEIVVEIPSQSAISQDNVTLHIDGVLYLRIDDPYKASYGVEDPEYAVSQLAQTTMRSEIGQLTLDAVFKERAALNANLVDAINSASEPWGLECLRCEIRDIALPDKVVEDMQRQVSAERRKRASVLESEGEREAAINRAEGLKRSSVLKSEGKKLEQVNEAEGQAEAIKALAAAEADAIGIVSKALAQNKGQDAAALKVAEQYIDAFKKLAKEGNTVLLPSSVGDPASMVAQAMSIYNSVSKERPTHPSGTTQISHGEDNAEHKISNS